MKRVLFLFAIFFLCCSFANAQEHVSFNGATFGVSQKEFQSSLNGHPSTSYLIEHSNKNLYHRYFYDDIPLSTYRCKMFLHCSLKSKTVFETITWFNVTDLKEELMYFVKVFEEKYGEHIEEPQSDLGLIDDGNTGSNDYIPGYGYYVFHSYPKKEMLALKYIIHRKTDNKAIGEIRISAAPSSWGTSGIIEITYRDYAAAQKSISEYNNTMNDIL